MTAKDDTPLEITFPFEPGQDFDLAERIAFWDSSKTINFFLNNGYTLYQRIISEDGEATASTTPALPFEKFAEAAYPYAYYDAQFGGDELIPLCTRESRGKVVFAQDPLGRHVAIKLVRDNTDEYRILRFLSRVPPKTLQENSIVPILDFLPLEGFWFVVMPRWGGAVRFPEAENLKDVLDLMRAMLKALTFLHAHNISHGDISDGNVLVNHFCDNNMEMTNTIRKELRAQGRLSYGMFDFDFSIMLLSTANKEECRLPYERSWGTFTRIKDTAQGEFDYNPFSFDVGNMGALFCRFYQHLSREAPFLAPLLDRMTTRDLNCRFTASQALQFFDEMSSQMSQSELGTPIWLHNPARLVPYDEFNRWEYVPPDLARKWTAYREPPIPWITKALRWICASEYFSVYKVIARIRWFLHKLAFPQRFCANFVGFRILPG
ncbi:other/AgaK1 protein kinase [Gymnopilus junonius]|uniref:Other/AgaK1 protein kinase n=1 Tax=Gymnopilus junonius TaxID=109634 RepID=A0A9P5NTJ7_GYMJU|nr:other/AgaK1 protein kinase [Gymnopilus junonius]